MLMIILAGSASAFMLVENWQTPEIAFIDDSVETWVTFDLEDLDADDDIKVVFIIPELAVRASRGPYDPAEFSHTQVRRDLFIPDDAEPGEYVIRMTVTDEDGNKRIRHRFVEIE